MLQSNLCLAIYYDYGGPAEAEKQTGAVINLQTWALGCCTDVLKNGFAFSFSTWGAHVGIYVWLRASGPILLMVGQPVGITDRLWTTVMVILCYY